MDAYKVYTAEVAPLVEGRRVVASSDGGWSKYAAQLVKLEGTILDFGTRRNAVDPGYASIPAEATLEAAKALDRKFYEDLVGVEGPSTQQGQERTRQVPKHCLCLCVDLLSMLLGIDQKEGVKLLIENVTSKGTRHSLRVSVSNLLEFLLSPPNSTKEFSPVLPLSVLEDSARAWNRQRHYQLKCIRGVVESAAKRDKDNPNIREITSLAIRWSKQGLLKSACAELMVTIESIREHSKVRDALAARAAAYEANLARVGASLQGLSNTLSPIGSLPLGSLDSLFLLNNEALLRRAWDLLSIMLALVSLVHVEELEDFQQLLVLCPNLVSFKTLEKKHPLGVREPERGITATEYDLFVEQNLFEKEWSHSQLPLFEITPILVHVITAALHPALRRISTAAATDGLLSTEDLELKLRTKPLPFLDEKSSTPSLMNCISSENGWGRLVLWLTCGIVCNALEQFDEQTFKMGILKWNCLDQLREVVISRHEPHFPVDYLILRLVKEYLEPFFVGSLLNPTRTVVSLELHALAPPHSNRTSIDLSDWATGGDLTTRRSRLDTSRLSMRSATRRSSPKPGDVSCPKTGILFAFLMLFDALGRRLPKHAEEFIPLVECVADLFSFNDPNDSDSRSATETRSEMPQWGELLGKDEEEADKLWTLVAFAHLGSTLMTYSNSINKNRVAHRLFFSQDSRALPGCFATVVSQLRSKSVFTSDTLLLDLGRIILLSSDAKLPASLQIALWDGYLRCLSAAGDLESMPIEVSSSWVCGEDAIAFALACLNVDLAALPQKVGYNLGFAHENDNQFSRNSSEAPQEGLEWVRLAISFKIAALSVIASSACEPTVVMRQLIRRLSNLKADIWILSSCERSMKAGEARKTRSNLLLTVLWTFTCLFRSPANHEVAKPAGSPILGWQHLIRFIESEILPWLQNADAYELPCWRLLALLFELITTMLLATDDNCSTIDRGGASAESYLASHLLSDTSPWLRVLFTAVRAACCAVSTMKHQAAYAAQDTELCGRVIENSLQAAIGLIYQLVFREEQLVGSWKTASLESAGRDSALRRSAFVERICLDVLPGSGKFTDILCIPESNFVWTAETSTGPSTIILLAKYMTTRVSSVVSRMELLPIFCKVCEICGPRLAAELRALPEVKEALQDALAIWLATEDAQISDVVSGDDKTPEVFNPKIEVHKFSEIPPTSKARHGSSTRFKGCWEPHLNNRPRQSQARVYRAFLDDTQSPHALHGVLDIPLAKLVALPVPEMDEQPDAISPKSGTHHTCAHLTRHIPGLQTNRDFRIQPCDPREAPRRQILHLLLTSLAWRKSSSKDAPLNPGELLVGLVSIDRSLQVRVIVHSSDNPNPDGAHGMPALEDSDFEIWDDDPSTIKILKTLCLLANLDIEQLRSMSTDMDWIFSSLAPVVDESILACRCLVAFHSYETMRDVLSRVAPLRSGLTIAPFIDCKEESDVLAALLLEWQTHQLTLLEAEILSKMEGLENDFDCGRCLGQMERAHGPANPTRNWNSLTDARGRQAISRLCKFARAIGSDKAETSQKAMPKFLLSLHKTALSAVDLLRARSSAGDSDQTRTVINVDLLLKFLEAGFLVYVSAGKLMLEQSRQTILSDPAIDISNFRENFWTPVDRHYRSLLQSAASCSVNDSGRSLEISSFFDALTSSWGFLWADLTQLLLQRVIYLCTRAVGERIPIDRSLIMDICASAGETNSFARRTLENLCSQRPDLNAGSGFSINESGRLGKMSLRTRRLCSMADEVLLTACTADSMLMEREINEDRDFSLIEDDFICEKAQVLSPLQALVDDYSRGASYDRVLISWAEDILKDLLNFDRSPRESALDSNEGRARLMACLSLLYSHVSEPLFRNDQNGGGGLSTHTAVKLLESSCRLATTCSQPFIRSLLMGSKILFTLLKVGGGDTRRQILPLLPRYYNWQQLLLQVPSGAVETAGGKATAISPVRARCRVLEQICRTIMLALSFGRTAPFELTHAVLLEDVDLTPENLQLLLALASTEWMWSFEFTCWKLISDAIAAEVTEASRRLGGEERAGETKKEAGITGGSPTMIQPPLTNSESEIGTRPNTVWKYLEVSLTGALQAAQDPQDPQDKSSLAPHTQALPVLHAQGDLIESEAYVIALQDLLAAGGWYGLCVYRVLSGLTSSNRLSDATTAKVPGTDLFDRISATIKSLAQVRRNRYKFVSRKWPSDLPLGLSDFNTDARARVFDKAEIQRQKLLLILLRCLRRENAVVPSDIFLRTCRQQRVPDTLETVFISVDNLTTVIRGRPASENEAWIDNWEQVLVGSCIVVTMVVDILGVYLATMGNGDRNSVRQEAWNVLSSDHRGFLERTLLECLSSFKELSRSMIACRMKDDILGLAESTRGTLEQLTTILFRQ